MKFKMLYLKQEEVKYGYFDMYFNGDLLCLIDELALHFDRDIANQILVIFGMFHISKGNDRPMLYLKIKDI